MNKVSTWLQGLPEWADIAVIIAVLLLMAQGGPTGDAGIALGIIALLIIWGPVIGDQFTA